MNRIGKTVSLVAFVALLSAGPAFTQSPSDEEVSKPTVAAAPVAHVYVQTTKGVNAYDAASNGKLTLVKGSPFQTVGEMIGSNGKFFITLDTTNVNSYAVESNGAIGEQVSTINTQDYGGSDCGIPTPAAGYMYGPGAVLDHTGKFLYVQMAPTKPLADCNAWQSYQMAKNGDLTFIGDVQGGYPFPYVSVGPVNTISSNDNFAYGVYGIGFETANTFSAFVRTSEGVLDWNYNFTHTDPTPDPTPPDSNNNYVGIAMAADPNGHLAVLMNEAFSSSPQPLPQVASYTIDEATGGIASNNTWKDMPATEINTQPQMIMRMSPSGKLVAVAGEGIQIFHFNGAAPVTHYSSLLDATEAFDQMAWDNNNHLYALGGPGLRVYTVTPTSITEARGSPYNIDILSPVCTLSGESEPCQNGLIVVPKL